MTDPDRPKPDRSRGRRRAAIVAALLLSLLLLLLPTPDCGEQPAPQVADQAPLLVPADLARRFDVAGILDYCREQIAADRYPGAMRGAHGALWAGRANPLDRALLAAAALEAEGVTARVTPAGALFLQQQGWQAVDLASGGRTGVARPPAEARPPADLEPALFHTIRPAFLLHREGGRQPQRVSATDRLAEWIYRPVVLECLPTGYELRVGRRSLLRSGPLAGVTRAVLELTWRHGDQPERVWRRELFDRANAAEEIPGHPAPTVGDLYAVALVAGPLVPEVFETRRRMLVSADHTPLERELARDLVLLATRYFIDADLHTSKLAARTGVSLSWPWPRMVITASEKTVGRRALSMDVIADDLEAAGKRRRAFHVARGQVNDQIETRLIYEATGLRAVSASSVFSLLASRVPDRPARRLRALLAEGRRLLAEGLLGTRLEISAGPQGPRHTLTRTVSGLRLDEQELGRDVGKAAELVLRSFRRQAGRHYRLRFALHRAQARLPLPLTHGSVLLYHVTDGAASHRVALRLTIRDGRWHGETFGLDPARPAALHAGWRHDAAPAKGATVRVPVMVAGSRLELAARPVGPAQVLLDDQLPLVLRWRRGARAFELVEVSPVLRARVVDRELGTGIAGAELALSGSRVRHRAAADGSLWLATPPRLFRRLLIVLDTSGSMRKMLSRRGYHDRRIHAAKRAVRSLLARLPEPVQVALWTFPGGGKRSVRKLVDYTTDRAMLRGQLDAIVSGGGTPLTGAVAQVVAGSRGPLGKETVVVLLADGENDCKEPTSFHRYAQQKGAVAIHTIGFMVGPNSAAATELRELARISGGSCQLAGNKAELTRIFEQMARKTEPLRELALSITAPGYRRHRTVLALEQLAQPQRVALTDAGPGQIITVDHSSRARLDGCRGLSVKARRLIEQRLADGRWLVTIPTRRVDVGGVTAYGWFEIEKRSGRIHGRTEDGLHGSVADPFLWPPVKKVIGASNQPLVAWVLGISAYTAGSVTGAMRWHRQPGFYTGDRRAFERFLQAHALDHAARWWSTVGSGAFGGRADQYWAGVCLNQLLQTKALGGQASSACLVAWLRDLCERMEEALRSKPVDAVKGKVPDLLKMLFGEEWAALIRTAAGLEDPQLIQMLEKRWQQMTEGMFGCARIKPGR